MEKEAERIFRLLKILYPAVDMHSAYVGLQSNDPVVHDNAVEFLDSVLPPEMRAMVIPLFDRDVPVAERIAVGQPDAGRALGDREEAIEVMALSHDPWLRSCAAYAMGEMRLTRFAAKLDVWAQRQRPAASRDRHRRARKAAARGRGGRRRRRALGVWRPGSDPEQGVPRGLTPTQLYRSADYCGPIASAAGESGHLATGRAV